MSYVSKKGYIKEYEADERTAGLAVFECKVGEDLWIAADDPPAGTVLPELEAFREAKAKVIYKDLVCAEVAGKMLSYTKISLAKMLDTNGPQLWHPKSMYLRGRIYKAPYMR